jgi:hypothetical protein
LLARAVSLDRVLVFSVPSGVEVLRRSLACQQAGARPRRASFTPVFSLDRDLVCQGRLRLSQLARKRARDQRKGGERPSAIGHSLRAQQLLARIMHVEPGCAVSQPRSRLRGRRWGAWRLRSYATMSKRTRSCTTSSTASSAHWSNWSQSSPRRRRALFSRAGRAFRRPRHSRVIAGRNSGRESGS